MKTRLRLLKSLSALTLFLILTVSAVAAQDTNSVFGIRLGQPLTLPECARNEYLWYVGTGTCYKRDQKIYGVPEEKKWDKKYIKNYQKNNPPPPLGTEQVMISFATADWPQYVQPMNTSVLLIDGRVEGVQFYTFGISDADSMRERLKQKFGGPTSILPLTVKNRLGLPFDAFIATWQLPNVIVTFWSVDTSLDHGRVTVDTKNGDTWRTQQLKASLKDKVPM
jgi:hypothetical protein